jgi:hypothetical protein
MQVVQNIAHATTDFLSNYAIECLSNNPSYNYLRSGHLPPAERVALFNHSLLWPQRAA